MTLASSLAYTALQTLELGAIFGLASAPKWGMKLMGSMKDMLGDRTYVPTPATIARDVELLAVKESNDKWFNEAMEVVAALPDTFEGLGEDIRYAVIEKIGPPSKPQAWGSLTAHAIKKGYLVPTGEWRKMTDVNSHARQSMVLKKSRVLD